jgi:hypothetical protein
VGEGIPEYVNVLCVSGVVCRSGHNYS